MARPQTWTHLVTAAIGTAGVAALGGLFGALVGQPVSVATALCGLPIAVAAAIADRARGMMAGFALGAVWLVALVHDRGSATALTLSLVTAASVAVTIALVAARRRQHERTIWGLERLNHQMLGEVARRPDRLIDASPSEEEVVGYATTLLTLQAAGRRIATHLDLDTLVPTIVASARSALKCRHAAVYFWDGRSRRLTEALPPRSRDAGRYAPDATRGIAKWVIETRQVYTSTYDESLDAELAGEAGRPAGVAPLLAGNELLGLLVVDEAEQITPSFGRMLYILANLAALGLKNAQLLRRIEDSARRDPLTGLLNRGGFETAAEELLDLAGPARPLTLMISDLDNFKLLNDEHGHQAGDVVLREAARLWRAALPAEAVIARYGGEEFIALLPDCDQERGCALAEGLRETLADYPFIHNGETLRVTASFGVAELAERERDLETLLRRADAGLYQAKAEGRNCVRVADVPPARGTARPLPAT